MRYLHFPMVDSTSNVHEPRFNTAWNYPLPNPTADPFPRITAWPQHTQNQYPMSNEINNINTQWPVLTMSQLPSHERSALIPPNTVSGNEMYGDDPIMEHYPSPVSSIVSQTNLPTTEFNGSTTHTNHLLQYASSHQSAGPSLSPESPNSPSLAVSQRSSRECYDFWKRILEDAIIITGSDKFIPQTLYRPLTRADQERYLELVHLSPPIIFLTKEPFEWGISLEDVRNGKTQRLMNKDDPVLQNCGSSVCIRINWPGYSSFQRRIPSRNWRKTKDPITKDKLARNLANITGQFIKEMSHKSLEVDADPSWRVGAQHIKVEDLILVSLHHVSKGSWQPQLRLRHTNL